MASYIARRVLQAIPILFGVALITFLLVYLSPGDPFARFLSPQVQPETIARLREIYGLDRSLHEQFIVWLVNYVQVWNPEAWGVSISHRIPVRDLIFDRVPTTVLLLGTALLVTIVIAIPLGMIAAVRQYSLADKIVTTFATVGYAMPSFLLGIYLLYFGAVYLRMFPFRGLGGPDPMDVAWHLVLPVSSLAIQSIAGWSRYVRASMLEVMQQDYIRTARAKGLAGTRVNFRHALRNALIPVITLLGISLPGLLSGAIITEQIFSIYGLGQLGIQAVAERDYPVIMAFVMLGGVGVILGNLLADILYGVADPRIKY